jgi:hypothetical protein
MRVDMKSFLISGEFGQISFPATRQDVAAILGEPDDWTAEQPRSRASIWKYANVEFHFAPHSDAVWMIFTDDLTPSGRNSALTLDTWIIGEQLRLEDAEAALLQAGIVYQRISNPILETIDLLTVSNITLRFSSIEPTDGGHFLTSWAQQDQQQADASSNTGSDRSAKRR